MSSANLEPAHVDAESVTDTDLLKFLEASPGEALKTLNGEILNINSPIGIAQLRFEVLPAFCHSQGKICQGGFLTSMADAAMAMAATAKGRLSIAVVTLDIKVSFFEAMGPGVVFAKGSVKRWGKSIGFLEGELKDDMGRLILHSTSTIKIARRRS
jgi:acyl-CoA thioesterase